MVVAADRVETSLRDQGGGTNSTHLRQILAPRAAWIIPVVCNLLRALGCKFIEPINELAISHFSFGLRPRLFSILASNSFSLRTVSK